MTNAALVHMMMLYDVNFQRFPPAHSKIKSPLTSPSPVPLPPLAVNWEEAPVCSRRARGDYDTDDYCCCYRAEDARDIAGNGECTHLHITCYGNGKICQRCVE